MLATCHDGSSRTRCFWTLPILKLWFLVQAMQRLSQVNKSQGVWVTGAHVQFTDAVKLLGVTLDSTLSFDKHIIDVTRSCHYHIRAMRHIRPLLTLDAGKAIPVSIVGCRLDYCNIVLYGMSQANIDKLQHVQNILARVVVKTPWTCCSLNIRRNYIGYLLVIVLPTKCVSLPRKHFIPLSLSTSLNSFLIIFRKDPCVLPIQISLPHHPVY